MLVQDGWDSHIELSTTNVGVRVDTVNDFWPVYCKIVARLVE